VANRSGLCRQIVQSKIEFQDVHPRFAKQAQIPLIRVLLNQVGIPATAINEALTGPTIVPVCRGKAGPTVST
jgi:hypothetical protein